MDLEAKHQAFKKKVAFLGELMEAQGIHSLSLFQQAGISDELDLSTAVKESAITQSGVPTSVANSACHESPPECRPESQPENREKGMHVITQHSEEAKVSNEDTIKEKPQPEYVDGRSMSESSRGDACMD